MKSQSARDPLSRGCHCFTHLADDRNGPKYLTVELLFGYSDARITITCLTDHSLCKSSSTFISPRCKVNTLRSVISDAIYHNEENYLMYNGYMVYRRYSDGWETATAVERCRKHVAQRLAEIRLVDNCNGIIPIMTEFMDYTSGPMCNKTNRTPRIHNFRYLGKRS